jgi:plasmid replication initiation protein
MALSPLLPERHPQKDFFIADIFDSLPFKDDMATMEHPMFTLSTKPDKRALQYQRDGIRIEIQPSYHGLPTIFDKDVLLYCGSQLMERINQGDDTPPRTMRISLHDLLIVTNRKTNGEGYRLIKNSLNRLTGSLIKTNIETGGMKQESMFHILDSAEFIESKRFEGRLVALEVTLSEWFYNSLIAKQVLTIDREYFRLRKSIDRRLYEIARKHCGSKHQWSVGLDALHAKSGSRDVLTKFRAAVRLLEKENHLPEYQVSYNRKLDLVTFTNRREAEKTIQGELALPPADIPPDLAEEGRAVLGKEQDVYSLWAEWQEWNQGNGNTLVDWRRAFLGFCRKRSEN